MPSVSTSGPGASDRDQAVPHGPGGTGVHDSADQAQPDCLQVHDQGLPAQPADQNAQSNLGSMDAYNNPQHRSGYDEWSAWDDVDDAPVYPIPDLPSIPHRMTGPSTSSSATRIGYATTYDPESDPWHEEGHLDDAELGPRESKQESLRRQLHQAHLPQPAQQPPVRQPPTSLQPHRPQAPQDRRQPMPKQPPPKPSHPQTMPTPTTSKSTTTQRSGMGRNYPRRTTGGRVELPG